MPVEETDGKQAWEGWLSLIRVRKWSGHWSAGTPKSSRVNAEPMLRPNQTGTQIHTQPATPRARRTQIHLHSVCWACSPHLEHRQTTHTHMHGTFLSFKFRGVWKMDLDMLYVLKTLLSHLVTAKEWPKSYKIRCKNFTKGKRYEPNNFHTPVLRMKT